MQQWRFLVLGVMTSAVIASFAFYLGFIPLEYAPHFYIILVITVLNSQFENFMVGAGQPVAAALNLLLRSVWILPLFVLSVTLLSQLDMHVVLSAWLVAELFAVLFISFHIWRLGFFPKRWYPVDLALIIRGAKVGARYTFLALLLLVTVSVQRVVLGHSHTEEQVGIFHFFFVISVFIPNLLEASLYAIILPRLIAFNKPCESKRLSFPELRSFFLLLGGGGGGLLLVAVILPYGLTVLQKPELMDYRYIFMYTASYALLYTGARVFHYQLYTSHNDKALNHAYAISSVGACLTSVILIPPYGLHGAAISLVIAGLILILSCAWPFISTNLISRS